VWLAWLGIEAANLHFFERRYYLFRSPAKFNSDGIALTPDGQWLYFKPLSDDKLYRIVRIDITACAACGVPAG
jgi:streptogramin lyase